MITMQVTKEEYEMIQKSRKEQGFYKPIKIGFLKEDMWLFHRTSEFGTFSRKDLFTTTDKEKFLNNLSGQFEIFCKKGTKFYCYLNDIEEVWQGPGDPFECMTRGWAKEHLTDIKIYEQD